MRLFKKLALILSMGIIISSAAATNVTVSGGKEPIVMTITTNPSLGDEDSMVQSMLFGGDSAENSICGTGSLNQVRVVSDSSTGNYARTYADVRGAHGITSWSYDWYLTNARGSYVRAEEWLSAGRAYSINAYGYAENAERDQATASTSISSGSYAGSYLNGYYASAIADRSSATAYQSASSASGASTVFYTWSGNLRSDTVEAYTRVLSGSASCYSASATARRLEASAQVFSLSASAPGGSIYQLMRGSHQDTYSQKDRSTAEVSVNKGYLYSYPYSGYYPARAYSSQYLDTTSAVQSVSMRGTGALAQAEAYNYGHGGIGPKFASSSNKLTKVGNTASTTPGYPYRSASAFYLS